MTEEKRSRVLGMILASVSRGVFPQREPIGYLYGHVAKEGETPTHTINGVDYVGAVLPKLPEWDRQKYPYAYIYYSSIFGYSLFYSGAQLYAEYHEGKGRYRITSCGVPVAARQWWYQNERWDHLSQIDTWLIDYVGTTIWSNADMYLVVTDESGNQTLTDTVYLPESEPVPVYEQRS